MSAELVAVASCPSPPLLLPGLTGQPVAEVEQLRAACLAAIGQLMVSAPDRIVLVGGRRAAELADLDASNGQDVTPVSIAVGRSLLAQAGLPGQAGFGQAGFGPAGAPVPVEQLIVDEAADPKHCLALGGQLIEGGPSRLALLVMADGSACRTVKAPGYLDERAAGFDAGLQQALAEPAPAVLAALDPTLAAELLVAGRAAWQVLAGAAGAARVAGAQRFTATVHYADDPFGVWYPVVSWLAG